MKKYALIPHKTIYMRKKNKWCPAMFWESHIKGWVPTDNTDLMIDPINTTILQAISRLYKEEISYYSDINQMLKERFDEFI